MYSKQRWQHTWTLRRSCGIVSVTMYASPPSQPSTCRKQFVVCPMPLGRILLRSMALITVLLPFDVLQCKSMATWSLRWHFTNKSVTEAPYSIKSYSLSHSWTLRWRVRWLKHAVPSWGRGGTADTLQQQRWHRMNRRQKSIPRSSSSHREGSITQRGASHWW